MAARAFLEPGHRRTHDLRAHATSTRRARAAADVRSDTASSIEATSPPPGTVDWEARAARGLEDDAVTRRAARLLDELARHAGHGRSRARRPRRLHETWLVTRARSSALLGRRETRYGEPRSAERVARRSSCFVEQLGGRSGCSVSPDAGRMFGDTDVEAARLGATMRRAAASRRGALEVARVLGRRHGPLRRVARARSSARTVHRARARRVRARAPLRARWPSS